MSMENPKKLKKNNGEIGYREEKSKVVLHRVVNSEPESSWDVSKSYTHPPPNIPISYTAEYSYRLGKNMEKVCSTYSNRYMLLGVYHTMGLNSNTNSIIFLFFLFLLFLHSSTKKDRNNCDDVDFLFLYSYSIIL
jgi:hypothetical protein